MKHAHEKLAEAEPKLEEDIIVPTRRKVMEGGGLSLERPAPSTAPQPARPHRSSGPLNPTGRCRTCGRTVSYNKFDCRACAEKLGVA